MSTFFIDRKKHLLGSMRKYEYLKEFSKSYKRLKKKYQTLDDDFEKFCEVLEEYPEGVGRNFVSIYMGKDLKIIKARMACRALREHSLRVVYGYHQKKDIFYFLEIYYKGDQENESRSLINSFLKEFE